MKILFKILSVFLYFYSVSPVLMYYIYDDNPNVGFVAIDNGIGSYVKTGFSNNGKKQFTGSYSQKHQKLNNEHVVDSHFKVMKTPTRFATATAIDNARPQAQDAAKNNVQRVVEEYRNTEAPMQRQRSQYQQALNTANPRQQDIQNTQTTNNLPVRGDYGAALELPSNNPQVPSMRPKSVNTDYSNKMKQRSQRHQADLFETKPNFVQMNVRKTQMSDPQKIVKINNNRPLSALSVHGTQEQHTRVSTSIMNEKTLHKTNGLHDHNIQVMSRVLDDMTLNIADRKKNSEYKRDTTTDLDLYEKSKRSVLSENMRKYIGKDKNMAGHHRAITEVARIGSREESLENNDTPYALFYRMNPEALDQQDGFMLMTSMEDTSSTDFTNKEKRSTTASDQATAAEDTEAGLRQKSKRNGTLILQNYSNYNRNH